jgi:hypothetical protein
MQQIGNTTKGNPRQKRKKLQRKLSFHKAKFLKRLTVIHSRNTGADQSSKES